MIQQKAGVCVAAGMQYLDRTTPGWENQVVPEILDIFSPMYCMLAQLHGSYHRGLAVRNLTTKQGTSYGFNTIGIKDVTCDDLTEAWQRAIMSRRELMRNAA